MDTLTRVKRATKNRTKAEREWRDAILAAHVAGLSLRVIGKAAGVSHVYVLQLVRGH